jgi:hypothetical protein
MHRAVRTSSVTRYPTISLHFSVDPGSVFSWRLAALSELRVHHARIWLTRSESSNDYWLKPGDTLLLQRHECIWLSTDQSWPAEISLISVYVAAPGVIARTLERAAASVFGWPVPLPR